MTKNCIKTASILRNPSDLFSCNLVSAELSSSNEYIAISGIKKLFCMILAMTTLLSPSLAANEPETKDTLASSSPVLALTNQSLFKAESVKINLCIDQFDHSYYNKLISQHRVYTDAKTNELSINTDNALWNVKISLLQETKHFAEFKVSFTLKEGSEQGVNVGIDFDISNWSAENYVLLPGAAYNGNRFNWRKIQYSPKLLDPRDIGPTKPMIISDIPKLNISNGFSRIQERSGSMAIPSIGVFNTNKNEALYVLTSQRNKYGDYGLTIEESRDRQQARISLRSPLVREYETYDSKPSYDKPANFKKDDVVEITFKLFKFDSRSVLSFINHYPAVRKEVYDDSTYKMMIPFSSCFDIQEEKFNRENFVKDWGYYSVGNRANYFQDWQIGWTGGMISTYPLLFAGSKESKNNVIRNFDWLFPDGISPSGLFWCSGEKGNIWIGGDTRKDHTKNWHLVRKSGDGLYYVLKQFDLMKKMNIPIKPDWEMGTKKVANTFVDIWQKNKQFGQFIDNVTGKIQVGGSTSGAIVPGALVLASEHYKNPLYMQVAKESAEQLYKDFISKGITCGGPGDALQNPDSESAYAMLASFSLLYEYTHDKKWLKYAEEMANLYSTWVMAYDYDFPKSTTFGHLDMHSRGAVIANTQNKHGGPGACTYSGIALLRLYRITGKQFYLELLKETAFNLPQYLSRKDRPIGKLHPGYINERVNTTDWAEGIGQIFNGSTWAETSLMLTYIEIPGIYVDLKNKLTYSFDHVNVETMKYTDKEAVLLIENPTKFDAKVNIYVDDAASIKQNLGENILYGKTTIHLKASEKKAVKVSI